MTIQLKCDSCETVLPLAANADSAITDALPPAGWVHMARFDFCPKCVGEIRHFVAAPGNPNLGGPK